MRSVGVAFILLVAGCMPPAPAEDPQEVVRAKAATDFHCNAAMDVQAAEAKSSRGQAFTASGCGQQGSYEVICNNAGHCVAVNQGALTVRRAPPREQANPSTSGPAGTGTVSVTLRSECSETSKLFFGDKPGFSSGRSTTLGGNSRESASFRPGDKVWLLDAEGNGTSSLVVGDRTREIRVSHDCSSLTSR